jgi:rubrerythrin
MGFILDMFGALAIAAVLIWVWFMSKSMARDREAALESRKQEEAHLKDEILQKRLARPGEPLRCMGCDLRFDGPLPDTGCPRCHVASLVVPDDTRTQETADPQALQKQDG